MQERAAARPILATGRRLAELAQRVTGGDQHLRRTAGEALAVVRQDALRQHLATLPVAVLKDATQGRLRINPLQRAGLATVQQVRETPLSRLRQLPGLGDTGARQVTAAARQVAVAAERALPVRLAVDRGNPDTTNLLVAVHRIDSVEAALVDVRGPARHLGGELTAALDEASIAGSWLRGLFAGPRRREAASAAVIRVRHLVERAERSGLPGSLAAAAEALRRPAARQDVVWADFERRAATYYTLLGELGAVVPDTDSAQGFLPADITARVREQQLDGHFRSVALRGYQSFGARFALAQRRVIIGDEMGLGKTIQAIAAIAHLRAQQEQHFLVVCPASVLVNWTREIAERSKLTAYPIHGSDRTVNLKTWIHSGGVAVTTVDSLHGLAVPVEVRIGLLVVDEAHYVKNPQTRRSKAVREWANRVDRVIFLSGTPMENRLDEFKNLIGYLQPAVSARLHGAQAAAGAIAFRQAVAPAYLRRNQEDVLTELPELVRAEEWTELSRRDFAAYRDAVSAGNFMLMRQIAYTGDPAHSAKLRRLVELNQEAAANGRKVVVFSYFRQVLELVAAALGPACLGPLTGATPVPARQQLVDQFSAMAGHAVLVSQIQAGGVGLNIQAASVVIICEPQIKPTIEDQAVARSHRMGQVRSVQVHRLLTVNSVDQRMLELLHTKRQLFDEYARQSEMARSDPDAVDISEAELARTVVEQEQRRLAA